MLVAQKGSSCFGSPRRHPSARNGTVTGGAQAAIEHLDLFAVTSKVTYIAPKPSALVTSSFRRSPTAIVKAVTLLEVQFKLHEPNGIGDNPSQGHLASP